MTTEMAVGGMSLGAWTCPCDVTSRPVAASKAVSEEAPA